MYYLTKFDGVNNITNITSAYLCWLIQDINYFTFNCPFESGKGGKGKNTKT